MIANNKFKCLPKSFWADVRAIGQENGYAVRGQLKIPTLEEMISVYKTLSLNTDNIVIDGTPTQHALDLIEYFTYRADILHSQVEPRLMSAERAKETFEKLVKQYAPTRPFPMNKQKDEKKPPLI